MIFKKLRLVLPGVILTLMACSHIPQQPFTKLEKNKPVPTQPSTFKVEVSPGGPAVFTTGVAEFQVHPDGYIQAYLLKDGQKLSLDEPRVGAPSDSDYVVVSGKEIHFILDFQQAQVLETIGKIGVGKRLEIPAHPLGPSGTNLQRVLAIEAFDKFPNILLTSVEYKNTGTNDLRIEKSVDQRHRFSAKLVDTKAQPWDLWSYHGSGHERAKPEVVRLTRSFSQRNVIGANLKGGGIPIVAFWTREVGEALGHVETQSIPATIPVKVDSDGRVDTQLEFAANTTLRPGEIYSSPRNFLSVYAGDSSEPFDLWSAVPGESSEPPKPQTVVR